MRVCEGFFHRVLILKEKNKVKTRLRRRDERKLIRSIEKSRTQNKWFFEDSSLLKSFNFLRRGMWMKLKLLDLNACRKSTSSKKKNRSKTRSRFLSLFVSKTGPCTCSGFSFWCRFFGCPPAIALHRWQRQRGGRKITRTRGYRPALPRRDESERKDDGCVIAEERAKEKTPRGAVQLDRRQRAAIVPFFVPSPLASMENSNWFIFLIKVARPHTV